MDFHLPRVPLGFYPTPLYRLDNLSRSLQSDIYLKRDDLSGFNFVGGNKIRKLEYLIADAIQKKAETIITYGATQSNHAVQTVSACRKYNLKPVLFLLDYTGDSSLDTKKGNLLLDVISDAEVHIIKLTDYKDVGDAKRARAELANTYKQDLSNKGLPFYEIPSGGATPVGSVGFVKGFMELRSQIEEQQIDVIVVPVGTGGTLAGLCAGKRVSGDDTELIGFSVGPKDENFKEEILDLADDTLNLLGMDLKCDINSFILDNGYFGKGYEKPSDSANSVLKQVAILEGLLLDPVYTAKAFSGLLDYIEQDKIEKGKRICFWHTGGCTAIFSEKDIAGDFG